VQPRLALLWRGKVEETDEQRQSDACPLLLPRHTDDEQLLLAFFWSVVIISPRKMTFWPPVAR
jgi:hypothetical protein